MKVETCDKCGIKPLESVSDETRELWCKCTRIIVRNGYGAAAELARKWNEVQAMYKSGLFDTKPA